MDYFDFNKLFIIESLSPEEISKGYNIPNKNLINCLDSFQGQEKLNFFNYEFIQVNCGTTQFVSIIEQICEECNNKSTYPIIHFLGHGSQGGGIHLWDNPSNKYSMLKWKELYILLAKVNLSCHNNLFFTTAACYGFDSYNQLFADKVSNIPFVGIVAIDSYESFYVHDADIVFCSFYKTLLETNSVSKAVEAVKSEEHKLYGMMPYIAFSDDTFRKIYPKAQDQSYKTENIERLVDIVAKQLHLSPAQRSKTLSDFMNEIEKHKQEEYIRIRDTKFMFNDPLVKKERFYLPDSVNEL